MRAIQHTPSISATEKLARTIFTYIISFGDGSVTEVVSLQKEFLTLVRQASFRYEALRADLNDWLGQVTCGQVEFDPERENSFKEALAALVSLDCFLVETFDNYSRVKGIFLAKPRSVNRVESHRRSAEKLLDSWKSPEWETSNERTVKWDKEQTAYLRNRLESCK